MKRKKITFYSNFSATYHLNTSSCDFSCIVFSSKMDDCKFLKSFQVAEET